MRGVSRSREGRPEAGQVQQLIRSLGVTVEYDEVANLAELHDASSLTRLIQKPQQVLPRDSRPKHP